MEKALWVRIPRAHTQLLLLSLSSFLKGSQSTCDAFDVGVAYGRG